VKIIEIKITRCSQCWPHWSMGICNKEGRPVNGMHYPPSWCPLEDAPCAICGRAEQGHSPVDSCCKGFTMVLAPPEEER
jgi:hypothetical protein